MYTITQNVHDCLAAFASCIPPSVLKPKPGSHVIDACAAPGLKTLHLAEIMKGKGKLTAIEMDSNRCDVLRDYASEGGGKIINVLNMDFLELNPDRFVDVEFILVDPSCSGSGIVRREDKLLGEAVCPKRLAKLSGFQVKILCHALSFPNVIRVVYSTCSIMSEENENVVRDVLQKPGIQEKFRLKDFGRKPGEESDWQWDSVNEDIRQCKKTTPARDLCNGFFIAVFQRRSKVGKDE
ncbi:unnamed protein product [Notodromas monacha]|uniref:SAM-dependent MTase RsmB/NOP-type domain-containing protein n=1 Tax=Notodromas monacha TaxID=399045 RepID=A0A7R9BH00_9CRUS|nr:unnamed protein product [Notodromas monacha]CAG0915298.1 unnamed protein product [Notodromas monacha]